MTLNEAIEKYGKVPLFFSGYYKYCFTFEGSGEGVKITAEYGGNSDDIYRFDVSPEHPEFLSDDWRLIIIKDEYSGDIVFEELLQ